MASKPPSKPPLDDKTPAGEPASPLDDKFAIPVGAAAAPVPGVKPTVAKPSVAEKPVKAQPVAEDDEEDDETEVDDDEDDEDLVVFTAREAAGALGTIYAFTWPFLKNYKKMLAFVSIGVVIETLFNVIMPLSLKYLIDDALGEEDFQALVTILSVLAVAGIVTSIVAVWYERWDAKLAAQAVIKAFSLQRRTLGWFRLRNNEARD